MFKKIKDIIIQECTVANIISLFKNTFTHKYMAFTLLVVFFDQISKNIAVISFVENIEYVVNSFVTFQVVYNKYTILGSIENPFGDYSVIKYKIVYSIFCFILFLGIALVAGMKTLNEHPERSKYAKIGLFILMGGIFGNFMDRLIHPGVIDFIKLSIFEETERVMNLADIFILFGDVLILISIILIYGGLILEKLNLLKIKAN